jgi:hypothetical protein
MMNTMLGRVLSFAATTGEQAKQRAADNSGASVLEVVESIT